MDVWHIEEQWILGERHGVPGTWKENSGSWVSEDKWGHRRRAHVSLSQGYRGKDAHRPLDSRDGSQGCRVSLMLVCQSGTIQKSKNGKQSTPRPM